MGSGKTHTGLRLARRLGYPMVDLDEWIEGREGRSINDIFATAGEAYFRDREAAILRELGPLPNVVVSTGGGAPCFRGGMDWMLAHGTVVFLDPPVDVLVDRLLDGRAQRPLLGEVEDLRGSVVERLAARRPVYERAHIHLRPTYPNEDVARLVAERLPRTAG